jgi:SAM-dependent methyltransferase
MKHTLSKIKKMLAQFTLVRGVYFSLMWLYKFPGFIWQYITFKKQSAAKKRFTVNLRDLFPRLFDNTSKTGFDPHYTYHPAWAARIVAQIKPVKHVDVSSVLHFSTLVSAFVPVDFYDYRPAEVYLTGLGCKKGDLMSLPFADSSVESISCMHTIEHVGLGRYGDPIDPDGDIKAAVELARVVKKGGSLIFVTPVGKSKIYFNAHRIYSYDQVLALFPSLELREFSLVPDDFKKSGLIKNADKTLVKDQSYACGCFWFVKK